MRISLANVCCCGCDVGVGGCSDRLGVEGADVLGVSGGEYGVKFWSLCLIFVDGLLERALAVSTAASVAAVEAEEDEGAAAKRGT